MGKQKRDEFRKGIKVNNEQEELKRKYNEFYGERFESINELERNEAIKYFEKKQYVSPRGNRLRKKRIQSNVKKNRNEIREERQENELELIEPKVETKKQRFRNSRLVKGTAVALSVLAVGLGYILPKFNTVNARSINQADLEYRLQHGENEESLGINEDLVNRLQELETIANRGDLTKEEGIKLAYDTYVLNHDLAKTKIANLLGVELQSVVVSVENYRGEKKTSASVIKDWQTINYVNENVYDKAFGYGKQRFPLPESAKKIIGSIYDNKSMMEKIQEGKYNSSMVEECKKYLSSANKFAAAKITVDANGKMTEEDEKQNLKENYSNEKQEISDEER